MSRSKTPSVVVIGSGYVGLVTGVCFATAHIQTICVDIDKEKIQTLEQGKSPFYEPNLEKFLQQAVSKGDLSFSSSYASSLQHAHFCFLALPTPMKETLECDTSYLLNAAKTIGSLLPESDTPFFLINKSTAPVGTAEEIEKIIADELSLRKINRPVHILSNPEFLREGSAVEDCLHPERIVIGSRSQEAAASLVALYQKFAPSALIIQTSFASAEVAKYGANSMLAMRLSFINELAFFCDQVGADIKQVCEIMGRDSRIGSHYLKPGIGFGGSCLPKDVAALRAMFSKAKVPSSLLHAIQEINDKQPNLFIEKIKTLLEKDLARTTLALWGLSFKPDTDDLRESPALKIATKLISKGVSLRLYDPESLDKTALLLPDSPFIHYSKDPYDAAQGADAILLLTDWSLFHSIDLANIAKIMKGNIVIDGRFAYTKKELELFDLKLHYIGDSQEKTRAFSKKTDCNATTLR